MRRMKGWKTYVAAAGMAILGVISITQGDVPGGVQQIMGGLALIGLGHKIEKSGN